MLWGIKISRKQPDEQRPFGYGRELYFWSFIVSLIIFTLGGCISLYEGIMRLKDHTPVGNPKWNYIVLGASFTFTAISAIASLKAFNKQRGETSFWRAVLQSKDPSVFIVLLGDIGDILGLVIAFLGIYLGRRLHNPYYDGIASIAIGIVLILISLLLVRESSSLLMGEAISKKTLRKIIALAEADAAVVKIKQHFSVYLAPDEVVLQLIAVFKEDLNTLQITDAIERIIKTIQKNFPRIKQIFLEPGKV